MRNIKCKCSDVGQVDGMARKGNGMSIDFLLDSLFLVHTNETCFRVTASSNTSLYTCMGIKSKSNPNSKAPPSLS